MALWIWVATSGNGCMMPLLKLTPSIPRFRIITPFHVSRIPWVLVPLSPIFEAFAAARGTGPMAMDVLPIAWGSEKMMNMMRSDSVVRNHGRFTYRAEFGKNDKCDVP